MDNIETFEYYKCLMDPLKYKGCRVPSDNIVSSATFQKKVTMQLVPNGNGCILLAFNPFMLCTSNYFPLTLTNVPFNYTIKNVSGMLCSYDQNVDGERTWNVPVSCVFYDTSQVVPPIYSSYRLVSASLRVKNESALGKSQGIIGGGIFMDPTNEIGVEYNDVLCSSMYLKQFYDFNRIKNSIYWQENRASEGVEFRYFPCSNKDLEFVSLKNNKFAVTRDMNSHPSFYMNEYNMRPGFHWVVYGKGLEQDYNTHLEFCCNFECLVENDCLAYIHVSKLETRLNEKIRSLIYQRVREHALIK